MNQQIKVHESPSIAKRLINKRGKMDRKIKMRVKKGQLKATSASFKDQRSACKTIASTNEASSPRYSQLKKGKHLRDLQTAFDRLGLNDDSDVESSRSSQADSVWSEQLNYKNYGNLYNSDN